MSQESVTGSSVAYEWTGTQLVVTWNGITPGQGLLLTRELQRLDERLAAQVAASPHRA